MIYSYKLTYCGNELAGLVIADTINEALKTLMGHFDERDIDEITSLKFVAENNIIELPAKEANRIFEIVREENF